MNAQVRPRRAAALVAGLLLTVAACGSSSTPAERLPALDTAYSQIRSSLAGGHPEAARRQVEALMDQTTRAVSAGELTKEQGDRILAAAAQLLAALPAPAPSPSATSSPSATPTTRTKDDEGEKDDGGKPGKGRKSHSGHGG